MSKNSNVNPGQYKVGGRDRPDDLARERMKNAPPREGSKTARPKRASKGRKKT